MDVVIIIVVFVLCIKLNNMKLEDVYSEIDTISIVYPNTTKVFLAAYGDALVLFTKQQ